MNHTSTLRTALAAAVLTLTAAAASAADYRFDGSFTFSDISGVEGQTFAGTFSLDLPVSDYSGEVLLTAFSFSFGGQAYTLATADTTTPPTVLFDAGVFTELRYDSSTNGTTLTLYTGFIDGLHGTLDHSGPSGFSSGDFQISAVPEPESYALMLGGLGLVGWMARRRKA
jgi:PEP-CTERM motif